MPSQQHRWLYRVILKSILCCRCAERWHTFTACRCATETSNHRICWSTHRRTSSSCVTLAVPRCSYGGSPTSLTSAQGEHVCLHLCHHCVVGVNTVLSMHPAGCTGSLDLLYDIYVLCKQKCKVAVNLQHIPYTVQSIKDVYIIFENFNKKDC